MVEILSLNDFQNSDEIVLIRGFDNKDSDVYMPIDVRAEIQREMFGKYADSKSRFYRWVWEHKSHFCEETGKYLMNYSASFISHILSRGAYPAMAFDPRNTNVLSFESHQKWEFGDRQSMKIFQTNIIVTDKLRVEYLKLK